MKRESRAPLIIAVTLLVVPVLYVGSYLALVVPGFRVPGLNNNYRVGGEYAERFFSPLEQIDRKLRPAAWGNAWDDAANQWYSGPR
jgi:hypothetical protein